MNKICTSLEQSKKLIELGIDVNTADMYWSRCTITDFGDNTLKVSYAVEPCNISQFRYTKEDVPAWSLSALLELIPPYLGEFNEGIDFGLGKAMNGKWYSAHYLQSVNEDIKPVKTTIGETAVDACVEMIVWLKENKKI